MARNTYFKEHSGEQNILEDLTIETIKTMGKDMVYIPRTLVNEDTLFGEDVISKFDDGYQLEMYIQSVDGFEGEGDILAKFGLEIRDRIELVVSRKRFEQVVGDYENITDSIKEECVYFDIISHNEMDYVSYNCLDSKFDGRIGFMITDNRGFIRYFPKD